MRRAVLPRRPCGVRTSVRRAGFLLWVLVLLMATLLAALLLARAGALPALVAPPPGAGEAPDVHTATRLGPAPGFTLPLFGGSTFPLTQQRGHVVVINFWASWCPPCRAEAPRLGAAYRAYRSRGVRFVGVDLQDSETDARAFLRRFHVSYPSGPDRDLSIAATYGVANLPTTFFIDRRGQIRRRWLGEIQTGQLTAFIEDALR